MKDYPLVSILIPSYNHSRYILQALNSVVADDYPQKEIIIIDDGSKDDTKNVLAQWREQNLGVNIQIILRENKGVCTTLNELVSRSEGKYLLVLASDDYLVNNTIAERVEILEKTESKLVLISDASAVDAEDNVIYQSVLRDFHKANLNNYFNEKDILEEIIFKFSISGAVVMMDKDIFNITGPYPEDLKAEDLYFYGMAAIYRKIFFYDKVVSHYRWHGANTSGINPELNKTIIRTYFKFLPVIPGLSLKLKLMKRMIGLKLYS